MALSFAWDPAKAASNLKKHGVTFQEASEVFGDPLSITMNDPDHSLQELRYIIVGSTNAGRLVVVSHTERYGQIRLISARRATKAERAHYENG